MILVRYPHKKKSTCDKSGDHEGHSMLSLRPMQCRGRLNTDEQSPHNAEKLCPVDNENDLWNIFKWRIVRGFETNLTAMTFKNFWGDSYPRFGVKVTESKIPRKSVSLY